MKAFLLAFLTLSTSLSGETLINPIASGTLELGPDIVSPAGTVIVGGDAAGANLEGELVFSTSSTSGDSNFVLSINPEGEPITIPSVYVYGIANSGATLSASDFGEGTLLGEITGVSTLQFGQNANLDISSFVNSVTGADFKILLESPANGSGIFGSLQYYDERPSDLIATVATPEPKGLLLLTTGLVALFWHQRSPKRVKSAPQS